MASLSISPLSLAQATPNSKYHAFPLGYSAQFIAHLHDSVGRQFDHAEVSLSHQLNRYDTVIVSPESGNTTYLVKASKQGQVILKIWMTSSPHVADYVRVRVGYAIIPSLATIHLGSLVCFSTHLTEDKPGWWSAGEEGVMQLEAGTGVGRALGVGRTVVYHKIEDTVDTHTEVTVAKVETVMFNTSLSTLPAFTNGNRHVEVGDYLVPVEFLLAGGDRLSPIHTSPNKECLKVAMGVETPPPRGAVYYIQQVPFECKLELRDYADVDVIAAKFLTAQSHFDPRTGESYCRLLPINTPSSTEGLSVRDGLRLSLTVIASEHSGTYSMQSESLIVPFEPAFYLSRNEIILSAMDTTTEFSVSGLTHQLQAIKVGTRDCPL